MRRVRVEWLLVPLVLLPLLVAGALCLVARAAYRAQIGPFVTDGRGAALAWIDGLDDGGSGLRQRFRDDFAVCDVEAGQVDVQVSLRGRQGVVRMHLSEIDDTPWLFVERALSGLPASSLADASVRLAIESGDAPVGVPGVSGADRSFAELLREPTLDALRDAPLPAATKAYLVRRRTRDEEPTAMWGEAERLLSLVAAAERRLRVLGLDATGAHAIDGGALAFFGSERPFRVVEARDGALVRQPFVLERDDVPDVTLMWLGDGEADASLPGVAWSGHLGAPLSGTWAVLLPHGDAWWRASVFQRWFVLGAAVVLLLLAAPALLFVTIRRRARLDEARARFLNEIAHDLRTPLTSLRLYSEMLSSDDLERSARERYAEVIARESARLTALLSNLLDLSRLEGGKRLYDIQDVAVAAAARVAVDEFRALYPARSADVSVDGDPATVVRADPTALGRCLGNLLDNAGKFTEAGTRVRVSWSGAGRFVEVRISDDGPGIASDERASVFARYSRGARAQDDGIQGTGLGLSLVRELMQGMGGDVWLDDGAPGAEFVLRLEPGTAAVRRDVEAAPTTGGERA